MDYFNLFVYTLTMNTIKLVIILYWFLFLPILTFATSNAGLVDGIWLSDQTATEGESIQIFAVIQNQTDSTLSGTVTFYNLDIPIGDVNFSIQTGEFQLVTLDYTLPVGHHSISASITSDSATGLTNTKLPSKKVFILDKPEPEINTDKIITLPKIEVGTSTITEVVKVAADTVVETGMNASKAIFNTIDPKAQYVANTLREKSASLDSAPQNTFATTSLSTTDDENTKDEALNKNRLRQVASVGFATLAFVFENWLWHLALAGVLMIIRTLYRRRLN